MSVEKARGEEVRLQKDLEEDRVEAPSRLSLPPESRRETCPEQGRTGQ